MRSKTKRFMFGETILGSFIRIIVLFVIFTFPFFYFFNPTFISGNSMSPTYQDGELIIVKRIRYEYIPKRYDVVIIETNNEKWVKRVMGLPGEEILFDLHEVLINGSSKYDFIFNNSNLIYPNEIGVIVPENYVWVVGDNRHQSQFGLFHIENISGKVVY